MAFTSALAIYFVIWWLVLFAVLPFGIRSQQEAGDVSPGSDPGAPELPRLWAKLAWTSIWALVVFGAFYVIYVYRLLTIEDIARLVGTPD